MKKITLTLLGLGLFSSLFALDATDIEAKIQEIQSLPAQERLEKMNELKMEIRAMNENEREKVIEALAKTHEIQTEKTQMQTNMSNTQTQMQTKAGEMQHNMMEKAQTEHEMPEMNHEMPEIDHEMPEMDHEMPEIDHEIPEMDHDTIDKPEIDK